MPNYFTVRESSLGHPASVSGAVMRHLWALSMVSVPEALVAGCVLLSDVDEYVPARCATWMKVPADVLLLNMGPRSLEDVRVVLEAAVVEEPPEEAAMQPSRQDDALQSLMPTWIVADEERYVHAKEEWEATRAQKEQMRQEAAGVVPAIGKGEAEGGATAAQASRRGASGSPTRAGTTGASGAGEVPEGAG